ncbi:hypothetical protein [Actinomadura roseirufa]|uniref:hypothetical protein n=1 Tax=Actinomadura roseirufa TaxID=2094049 RepID=UPI0010410FC6|nr:hypothetical protein [Actinomadura roseirufa]
MGDEDRLSGRRAERRVSPWASGTAQDGTAEDGTAQARFVVVQGRQLGENVLPMNVAMAMPLR